MTLHLHRATRADRLADGLAELLRDPLPDAFATEVVSVPSRGVERWLAQRLGSRLGVRPRNGNGLLPADGVCAGVAFPSVDHLVADVAGITGVDPREDPWRPPALVWAVLEAMDAGLGPSAAPLASYLRDPTRRFATARRLAELFDSYGRNRPQMVRRWAKGQAGGADGEPLPSDCSWQFWLWQSIRQAAGQPSPAERLTWVCERLQQDPAAVDLPARLSVFGATRLSAEQHAVLSALAGSREVHLWLPHPSPTAWRKVADALQDADLPAGGVPRRRDPSDGHEAHRLLAYLGRDSRELQVRLLIGSPDLVDAEVFEDEAPARTLLGRLQAEIAGDLPVVEREVAARAGAEDQRLLWTPADDSLAVHAAAGPDRQVEVLREVLLGLLESDPTLEPRDVVVMCPDIETFAPLITAAFGLDPEEVEPDHPGQGLRVRLADRSLRQLNPLLAVLGRLLDLAGSRLTASAVLDLLALPPLRAKFRFSEDDLERLRELVAASGVRWGLDAAHRAPYGMEAFAQNTWRAGLDRLLLGVTMSEDGQHFLGTTLPLDDVDSSDVDLVGRLAEAVDRLGAVLDDLTGHHSLGHWMATLRTALEDLTAVPLSELWQRTQAQASLARVIEDAGGHAELPLTLAELRPLLADLVRGRPSRTNFRTGTLTMCTLVPMRSVPHRVVCLLGLDEGVFPRAGSVDGDDLLALEPHLGDRDRRSEDRQLLLDAILAAEEHLVVIYAGADPRTNQTRPPAVPVGELLDTLDLTARTADGTPVQKRLVVRHPLQPFDPANFSSGRLGPPGSQPFSFDRGALAGARAAGRERTEPAWFLEGYAVPPVTRPTAVELVDLARFFAQPARAFLKARAGLSGPGDEPETDDELRVVLEPLEAWAIGDRILREHLLGVDLDRLRDSEWRRGALPPRELGSRTLGRVLEQLRPIAEDAAEFAGREASSHDVLVELGGGSLTGTVNRVYGDTIATVSYGRLSAKQRITAWLELLALTLTAPERPWRAVVLARGGRCTLGPLESPFAERVLTDLLDLYATGVTEPLPLPVSAAAEYAAARFRDRPVEQALARARERWKWDLDATWRRVLRPPADFEALVAAPARDAEVRGGLREPSRFGALARRVWEPVLRREQP